MTQLTFYLSIYVVSIFWCRWVVTISEKNSNADYGIFTKEFLIIILSWMPVLNSFIAIVGSYEILEDKFKEWKIKRSVKKILKKISHNHKGEKVADDLNKIINNL